MLGMHPVAAYFGTDPDLSDLTVAQKHVTMLADTREKGLGLHLMLCQPGTKVPYDVRTDKEKEADQEEWTQYRSDLIARGQRPPSKERHPGGLYVATNNVKRLKKYLKAADKVITEARYELELLTTRDRIATVLGDDGDTSLVSPEELKRLQSIHIQLCEEYAEIEEENPRKNSKQYNRRLRIKPLVDKTALADHDRARIRSLEKQLEFPHPNLAVSVGPSNVVVVDCDTSDEVVAFQRWAAKMSGDNAWLRTKPTVSTPGVLGEGGQWKHKNGGHFWFVLPREIDTSRPSDAEAEQGSPEPVEEYVDTRAVLYSDTSAGTAKTPAQMKPIPETIAATLTVRDEENPDVKFDIFVNKHYVMIPPSTRPEGKYLATGPSHDMPDWLYNYILNTGIQRAEEAEARRQWREGRGALPESVAEDIVRWYEQTSWEEILGPAGWNTTGTDSCGCPIWQRPGGASYKSATAHQPGCTQHPGSNDPPIHFWTSEPGPEITAKLLSLGTAPGAGSGSLSKLQLAAALYFDGDDGQAMRFALGEGYTGLKISYVTTEIRPGLFTVNTVVESAELDEDDDADFESFALPEARPEDSYEYTVPTQRDDQVAQDTTAVDTGQTSTDPWSSGGASYSGDLYGVGPQSSDWPASASPQSEDYAQAQGSVPQNQQFGQPDHQAFGQQGFVQPGITGPQGQTAYDQGFGQQHGLPQPETAALPQGGGIPALPPPTSSPFGTPESDQPQIPRGEVFPSPQGDAQTQGFGSAGSEFVGQSPQPFGTPNQSAFGQYPGPSSSSSFSLFPGVDDYSDTTGGGADEDDGYDGPTLGQMKDDPSFIKQHMTSTTAPPFKSLDMLMTEREPVQFLVKEGRNGWIQDRALTVVAGPSNAGKSAVLLDILCTMAAEKTEEDGKFGVWMNAKTKRRNILYIAGEGIDGVVNRIAAWEHIHKRQVRRHMAFTDEAFLFDSPETAWQDLANRVIASGHHVVVFDTMATMMVGLEENSNDDMGKVMHWLHNFSEMTKTAVILVHHTGKSAENLSPRGASALTGAIASQILVQKREMEELDSETQERFSRDGITPIRVSVTKQKDSGYPDPLDLSLVRVPVPHRPGLGETDDFDQDFGHQTVLVGDTTGSIPTSKSTPPVVATPTTPRGYVSDIQSMALRIVTRVVTVGTGPESKRQHNELGKTKIRGFISDQQGSEGLSTLSAAQFKYEFANAVTLAINCGALREDGTLLHPDLPHKLRMDRDKSLEILLARVNDASSDDIKKAESDTFAKENGEGQEEGSVPDAPQNEPQEPVLTAQGYDQPPRPTPNVEDYAAYTDSDDRETPEDEDVDGEEEDN